MNGGFKDHALIYCHWIASYGFTSSAVSVLYDIFKPLLSTETIDHFGLEIKKENNS